MDRLSRPTSLRNSGLKFAPSKRFTSLKSASMPSSALCDMCVSISRRCQPLNEDEQSELRGSTPDGTREGVEDGLVDIHYINPCTATLGGCSVTFDMIFNLECE